MKKRVKIKDLVLSGLIGFLIGCGAFSINQNETKSTDNTIEVQATQQTQEETIEEKTTITIDVKKAFSNIESIIDNDAPFKDLVSEINKLELATEKSIETLATETENNIVCQKIIKKLYEKNGYKEELSKTFKKESFSVKNEVIFTKDAYEIEFKNEVLTIKNLTKKTEKQLYLDNFVQGVITTERIQIYSQLQKLDGALLEYIADEVGGITSAVGTNYGGWFLVFGIATLYDHEALAHETGHAISSHAINNWYVYFADELLKNETYHQEVMSMYKTGEKDEYVRSLIGNYEYEHVPGSEHEVYAECVRTILGYSDKEHTDLYKKFLPNTLKFVAQNMKNIVKMPDIDRGRAHEKQALKIPKDSHIKAAKKRIENGEYNTLYVNETKLFK